MNLRTVVTVIILLFSLKANAEFCTYRYHHQDLKNETRICSRVQLSKDEADFIHSWTQRFPDIYRKFLAQRLPHVNYKTQTVFNVAVVPLDEINTPLIPRHSYSTRIDGIYYQGHDILYISYESVLTRSGTLPHEMAHRINDLIGIDDPQLDEDLATQFEHSLDNGV